MASKFYTSSLFTHNSDVSSEKSPYSCRMMNLSPCKSSKISMFMASSATHCATIAEVRYDIKYVVAPLLTTVAMPLIEEDIHDYIFVDPCQPKVIPSEVDTNNRIKKLKEKTRRGLITTSDPTTTMKLIDTIQRLGVGYYFEEEIKELLMNHSEGVPDDDLYAVALRFRLQRQNGFHTNAEVFEKFMDGNGKFKNSLSEDIEGLVSLYEASYMGANGEDVLSQAMEFTTRHLKKSVSQLSPKFCKKIDQSLDLPMHMRMGRLEARRYIEEYGNEEDHNPVVLELAKLDYNNVQLLFQSELVEITRWWSDLGLASKLGFVRDRHVECFLWVVGLLPEPKYSEVRIELAKAISILLVLDDIFDTYGSYDDLVLFTKAIQRWDLNEMEQLPEYMNICYSALYNTIEEISNKVHKERGLSVQSFLRKTWIELVEGYMVEVEWARRGITPNVKDYIKNGIITSGTHMAMMHLFFFISEGITEEQIRHLLDPYPKFFSLAGTILRLWDDLGTFKEEQERGDVLSSIQLLMTEKHISCEDEGRKQILKLIHSLWKDLNTELVTPDPLLFSMIRVAFNTSRASQVVYQHTDNSYLSSVDNQVQILFFKPIDI